MDFIFDQETEKKKKTSLKMFNSFKLDFNNSMTEE